MIKKREKMKQKIKFFLNGKKNKQNSIIYNNEKKLDNDKDDVKSLSEKNDKEDENNEK